MNSNFTDKSTESAWMQITAGQGPRECAWVVARLSNIITHAAAKAGLSVEWMESQAFDKAPHKQDATGAEIYRSVILRIEGKDTARFTQTYFMAGRKPLSSRTQTQKLVCRRKHISATGDIGTRRS